MPVKTNSELKAFFNTGDQPSESNFADLIDTIQPTPAFIEGDADLSLTVADHAFRICVIDGSDADRIYTLPTPASGTWFHFIYLGDLDAADNFDFQLSNQSNVYFKGHVLSKDIGAANNDVSLAFDGTSSAIGLSLDHGASADLWVMGFSSTINYIWGNTMGAAIATVLS